MITYKHVSQIKRILIIFCILIFNLHTPAIANNQVLRGDYGVHIKSYPVTDYEKTSLVLENNEYIKLANDFSLSFKMKVREDNVFGVVSRIISEKGDNIDFSFTVAEDDKRYPMVVVNESVHLIPEEVVCNKWSDVKIDLLANQNSLLVSYDSIKITIPYSSRFSKAKITFGLCPIKGYSLYDIASVNIKDVKLHNQGRLIRYWSLKDHQGSLSYDSIRQSPAIVENAIWVAEIHSTWNNIYNKHASEYSLIAFNPKENLFYFTSPNVPELTIFDPVAKRRTTRLLKESIKTTSAPNQLLYDTTYNKLFSYNFDENRISVLSDENLDWSNNIPLTKENTYWNNSAFYDQGKKTLISFGGYGFYKYNNELIRFNTETKQKRISTLSNISPRSFASTTVVDNTLYVFGGRGNKAGRQELTIHNYYDFYAVDLLTEQVNKLWEIDISEDHFVASENMIYDAQEDCFYIFTTKDGGVLLKLRKDRPGFEVMSLPIYKDITSHFLYLDLFYSKKKQALYASISKVQLDNSVEVSLYSLAFPPVPVAPATVIIENDSSSLIATLILFAVALFIFAFIFYKRRSLILLLRSKGISLTRKKTRKAEASEQESTAVIAEPLFKLDYDTKQTDIYYISLLGNFKILDKSKNDITEQFSPMLKDILALLILYTVGNVRGIADKRLLNILWYDKSDKSAKNNRNVYLSRLRSMMEDVGDIDIENKAGYWSFVAAEDTCDYIEAVTLLRKIKQEGEAEQHELKKVLKLLMRGMLLPNTEEEWVDAFKSTFSNLTIDFLIELIQDNRYQLSDDLKIKIADVLLSHDSINEIALALKCSVYFNSGKKGLAKNVYDNFCKEYSHLLGIDYKYSLMEIVKKNDSN